MNAEEQYRQYLQSIAGAFKATGVAATSNNPHKQELWIPLRDGVKLYAYALLPEDGVASLENLSRPYPVILQRHPYASQGMNAINETVGREFAKRGYIYLCQHCRGTGKSEGAWVPNDNERADGIDTVDWLDAQPWCECFGMFGSSYLSFVGWAVADLAPAKLKSMFLGEYGVDRQTSMYKDGMIRHDIITSWSMDNAGVPVTADYLESCKYRPQIEVDEKLWGVKLPWYRAYLQNSHAEDPLWAQGLWAEFREISKHISIPLFVEDSWYDHHFASAIASYERMSEETKKYCTLSISSLNHYGRPCLDDRDLTHAMTDTIGDEVAWFEATLKRKELPKARIRTYEVGGRQVA